MKKQDMKELLELTQNLSGQYDQELADAVLTVSIRANQEITEELKGDEKVKALMTLFKPELDKAVEEAVEAARQKEMRTAVKMYQLGFGVEKIAQVMEYPEATVKEWLGLSAEVL